MDKETRELAKLTKDELYNAAFSKRVDLTEKYPQYTAVANKQLDKAIPIIEAAARLEERERIAKQSQAKIANILSMCSERSPRWRRVVIELEGLHAEMVKLEALKQPQPNHAPPPLSPTEVIIQNELEKQPQPENPREPNVPYGYYG